MYVIRYKNEREYWSKKNGWSEDVFQADIFPDKRTKLPVSGEWAPLWDVNEIQFARFIAESEAAGAYCDKDVVACLLESMDLTQADFADLVDRAQLAWERFKKKV